MFCFASYELLHLFFTSNSAVVFVVGGGVGGSARIFLVPDCRVP